MSSRKKIPTAVESEILFKSGRRCAICFGINADFKQKRGQLAHLDKKPDNNKLDNLAFLCLDHHDRYDSSRSQSKGWKTQEVKRYRDELYEVVADYRQKAWSPARKGKATRSRNRITHLKLLLAQRIKNLHALEEREAIYGHKQAPLDVVNGISEERTAIAKLEKEIADQADKLDQAVDEHDLENKAFEQELTESIPAFLIVENDIAWRDIIIEIGINQGFKPIACTPAELMDTDQTLCNHQPNLAVIGLPALDIIIGEGDMTRWIDAIVNLSRRIAIILLTAKDAQSVSLQTHRSIIQENGNTVAILPKETFNNDWFIQMFKRAVR